MEKSGVQSSGEHPTAGRFALVVLIASILAVPLAFCFFMFTREEQHPIITHEPKFVHYNQEAAAGIVVEGLDSVGGWRVAGTTNLEGGVEWNSFGRSLLSQTNGRVRPRGVFASSTYKYGIALSRRARKPFVVPKGRFRRVEFVPPLPDNFRVWFRSAEEGLFGHNLQCHGWDEGSIWIEDGVDLEIGFTVDRGYEVGPFQFPSNGNDLNEEVCTVRWRTPDRIGIPVDVACEVEDFFGPKHVVVAQAFSAENVPVSELVHDAGYLSLPGEDSVQLRFAFNELVNEEMQSGRLIVLLLTKEGRYFAGATPPTAFAESLFVCPRVDLNPADVLVAGRIVDENGGPIEGAKVGIAIPSEGDLKSDRLALWSTRTSDCGEFSLWGVELSSAYVLRVMKHGFVDWNGVVSSGELPHDVVLVRKP